MGGFGWKEYCDMSIIRREKSRIGVYHVLAQGAGNHELFHDEEDYRVFVARKRQGKNS